MISINVVFLGPSKDLADVESLALTVGDNATLAGVRQILTERFPRMAPALRGIRMAINHAFATDDAVLADGDEVALIPPVSGGSIGNSIWIELVEGPVPVDRARAFVARDPSCGGVVTFEGSTRRESNEAHGSLIRLDYEAYRTMAQRQLETLANEALSRWSLSRVAIIHRLGAIGVAEVSVVVAVAAAHRAECFEACRWLIDTLKRDVPIWKKDVYKDGTEKWVVPPPTAEAGGSAAPGD